MATMDSLLTTEAVEGVRCALEQAVTYPNRLADTVVVDNFCSWLHIALDSVTAGGVSAEDAVATWAPHLSKLLRPARMPGTDQKQALGVDSVDAVGMDEDPGDFAAPCCNAPEQGSAMYLGVGVFAALVAASHMTVRVAELCHIEWGDIWESATSTNVAARIPSLDRAPSLRLLLLAVSNPATMAALVPYASRLHEIMALFNDPSLHIASVARQFTTSAITLASWPFSKRAQHVLADFRASTVTDLSLGDARRSPGVDATNCVLTLFDDLVDCGNSGINTHSVANFFVVAGLTETILSLVYTVDRVVQSKAVRLVKRIAECRWLDVKLSSAMLQAAVDSAHTQILSVIEGRANGAVLDTATPLCLALLSADLGCKPDVAAFLHGVVVAPFGRHPSAPPTATPPDLADETSSLLICVERLQTLYASNAAHRKRGTLAVVNTLDIYPLPKSTMVVVVEGLLAALDPACKCGAAVATRILRLLPSACLCLFDEHPDFWLGGLNACVSLLDEGTRAGWSASHSFLTVAFESLAAFLRQQYAFDPDPPLEDEGLTHIIEVVQRRLFDPRWEVRDAAVYFCSQILNPDDDVSQSKSPRKGPSFPDTFLTIARAVLGTIWTATTADTSSDVRSSCWGFWSRFLTFSTTSYTRGLTNWDDTGLPDREMMIAALITAFSDTEAIVRRAALNLCIAVSCAEHALNDTSSLSLDVWPGGLICCGHEEHPLFQLDNPVTEALSQLSQDFDWEVKLLVLQLLRTQLGHADNQAIKPCSSCFLGISGVELLRRGLEDYDRLVLVETCRILREFEVSDRERRFEQVAEFIQTVDLPVVESIADDERILKCVPWMDIIIDHDAAVAASAPIMFTDDTEDPTIVGCY